MPIEDAGPLLRKAFEIAEDSGGTANMGTLANTLRRLDSSFDSRNYGKRQLIDLIQAFEDEFRVVRPAGAAPGHVVVRRAGR